MARKKKKGSKKKSSIPTPLDEGELERRELIQIAKDLKEKILNETAKKNELEAKLNQLQHDWDQHKDELQLKNVEREQIKDEQSKLRKSHGSHVDSVNESIKVSLHQNQCDLIKRKYDSNVELYKLQLHHSLEQQKKEENALECQLYLKNMQVSHNNFLMQLNGDYSNDVKRLQDQFRIKFAGISLDSERKLKEIREESELILKDKLQELEDKKERKVQDISTKNEKLLASLRNENNQKVHDQLNEIKRLKDEFMLKKKTLSRTEKKLSEIKAKHQNIVEPLKQAKTQVEELCVTMKEMKCEKRIFNQRKQKLRDAEDKLKNAQWRHEVLFQRFELLHEEREKLRSEFEKSTLELKQGNNLNSILAEKSKSDLYTKLKKECSVLLENNDGADQEKSILIGIQNMVEGMNAIPTKSEGGFPSLLTRSKNELVGTVPT